MSTPAVSLGYVILYVQDVSASLTFYEEAFGLARRFFHDDNGQAYGELETGATRLAFASLALAKANHPVAPIAAAPAGPPLGVEIALVTPDVDSTYAQAVKAGAQAYLPPAPKPWGQVMGYVRDIDGHLIEICSPLP